MSESSDLLTSGLAGGGSGEITASSIDDLSATSIKVSDNIAFHRLEGGGTIVASVDQGASTSLSGNTKTNPTGLVISSDGHKLMAVYRGGDAINQFGMSTPFDVSTATYDSISFAIGTEDTSPEDIALDPSGTMVFILGGTGNLVHQYSLTNSHDLSTISYDSVTLDVSNETTTGRGMAVSQDGLKLYVGSPTDKAVYQYVLTSAWDLSTASYDSKSLDVTSDGVLPYGLAISSDGLLVQMCDLSDHTIYQFDLSVAYDISTGVHNSVIHDYVSGGSAGLAYDENNNNLYTAQDTTNVVEQLALTSEEFAKKDCIQGILDLVGALPSTSLSDIVDDTTPQLGGDLDCNGAQIQWSQGADVASATALPVLTDGNYFDITGTTTVTSIDTTGGAGTQIKLHFDDILILTHHATNLVLPTGANITTAAGDEVEFVEYAAGDYRCTGYLKADGTALASDLDTGTTAKTAGSVIFSDGSNLADDNANLFFDDTNNRLGIGTNTPSDTLSVTGDVCIDHTASAADEHAIEIVADAAGFGDVKALDIDYITGAIGTEQEESAILINIDESASTGGEVFGLEVVTTTEGSATILGMKTGIGISPIGQFVGTFGDAASILVIAVDQATALSGGGAGNITTFVADDDTITIGFGTKFEEIEFIVDTGASGAGIAPTFEFSIGVGTWDTFTPTDGTNGFRNTGVVLFDDATIPGWLVGTGSEFLIRITRTRNTLGTSPILDLIQVSAVTEFSWDKEGDLSISDINVKGQLALTKGADVISATALPVLTDGNYFDVTGTTTITSINTTGTVGTHIKLHFDDVLTLTHDATNLILPAGGGNITTAAGDEAEFIEYAAGDYRCVSYTKASGASIISDGGISNVVEDTTPQLGGDLDCNGAQIQWSQGADVVADTALPVLTDGNYFDVTGTTTIATINTTGGVGTQIKLHFDAALTFTHDGDNIFLPGAANITTAAGDEAELIEYSTGKYRCTNYSTASGKAVVETASIASVVADTSPQLGGDLDLNSNSIDFPTTANISDCLDEDDMTSDSATMLATQQSIKAYVDTEVAGAGGGHDNSGYHATRHYLGGFIQDFVANPAALNADKVYTGLFRVAESVTFTKISVYVSTTGSANNARLGIYNMADGIPTSLVIDAGVVDVSGTGLKTATISQALSAGLYGVCILLDGTATVYGNSSQSAGGPNFAETGYVFGLAAPGGAALVAGCRENRSYGALPATYTFTAYEIAIVPAIFLAQ